MIGYVTRRTRMEKQIRIAVVALCALFAGCSHEPVAKLHPGQQVVGTKTTVTSFTLGGGIFVPGSITVSSSVERNVYGGVIQNKK